MKGTILFILLLFAGFARAQNDCVFNNDYKGLTGDWIEESDANYNFVWIEELKSYVARLSETETITLSAGGCYHSGRTMTYRHTEKISLDDLDFWMTKALSLAKEFQLDLFIEPLESKTYNLAYENDRNIIYEIPIDPDDGRIVEGIVLERDDNAHGLVLSYYIN